MVGVAKDVSRGLVDRGLARAGGGVGAGACMDLQGVEAVGHLGLSPGVLDAEASGAGRGWQPPRGRGKLGRNRGEGAMIGIERSAEVAAAQAEGRAVVALESTIITHGMPWPQNVET